jgi:UDP-N-acetylglucosamine:LPS N-acetylglucosamine transferase
MARTKKIKILLAGGGTGGHMYPLIAVADELKKQSAVRGEIDIRYFGDAGTYEDDFSARGIRTTHITTSKLRNYFSIQNIFDVFRFLWSIPQALFKIFFFMPNVCFTKGGPGTLSITFACRFYFIPIVVHESDIIPGRTNARAALGARIIELGFKEAEGYFSKTKASFHLVGNPVRKEITSQGNLTEKRARCIKDRVWLLARNTRTSCRWRFSRRRTIKYLCAGAYIATYCRVSDYTSNRFRKLRTV